ncbi:hypothetical protein PRNO82_01928 [Planktothrix rubescens]|nr:hypothetical protein PRNO82_01928 [Planktothrix rubescens]
MVWNSPSAKAPGTPGANAEKSVEFRAIASSETLKSVNVSWPN